MPPHMGHVGLCQVALSQCDQLTIFVCTREVEAILGVLRASWMKKLIPEAKIVHMHREIPQEPSEHPDFWTIWREAIREFHPEPIDVVFGSEEYIIRLAMELSAEPIIVDPDRLAFPVSGSGIRDNPMNYWSQIPGVVRSYYQKRVVMFGPESVGKSTLAKNLASAFGTGFVPEYGRAYDQYKESETWTELDFQKIASRQNAMRSAVSQTAGPILFEDTDPLLTAVWEIMLTGVSSTNLMQETPLADLYLLLDIDVHWENDGTRYFGDARRQEFMNLCLQVLEERCATFVVINGTWEERELKAVQIIQKL
jgi:HTH-type transcriptional regulator, transcriptional repressor of NAD biosynthesis genes